MNLPTSPGAQVRTAHGASDSISWQAVQTRTRTRPTVTTFGWRGKLALCCPPFAVIGFWAYAGAFKFGVIAVAFGLPMLWAALWWVKQVWVAGRCRRAGDRNGARRPGRSCDVGRVPTSRNCGSCTAAPL